MIPPTTKKFYLFGFPIAHSAAPALHNHCFSAWDDAEDSPNSYEIWSTSKVTDAMLSQLASDQCGGAAVTMPLKTEILRHLDEISPESRATGACNTIVKRPGDHGWRLVGQNTDILGVRNALLRALRGQFPGTEIPADGSYPASLRGAGLVIGGGATTRSAAYALTMLGLSPIYLINRDAEEVDLVKKNLPQIRFIHLTGPEEVERHLAQNSSPSILMAVGAIPAVAPRTSAERNVYTTASAVLTIPYNRPRAPCPSPPSPLRRIFLEMAYKPRLTPMLQVAVAHGWHGLDGVQAMIEQGLAQQRMWFTGDASVETGSDASILDPSVEAAARDLCEGMTDVLVAEGTEVDRALVTIAAVSRL